MASASVRLLSGLKACSLLNSRTQFLASSLRSWSRGFASLNNVQYLQTGSMLRPTISSLSYQVSAFNRSLHTKGDMDLVEFLKDEIKIEKEGSTSGGKLPKLKGFELTTSNGPNVTLTKKSDNETVIIKLNVNNSVDESQLEEETSQQEDKPAQMVSKPAFIVEISKAGGKVLAIQCVFPHEDDLEMSGEGAQGGDQYEDVIEIQDVAMLEEGQEWTDDVYSLSGALMDGNLYDMLLKLLEERGVDGELIQQLIDFSTAYEHKKYVSLLEQLKEFASAK